MSDFEQNPGVIIDAKINNPWASSRIYLPKIELVVCASLSLC